MNRSVLLILPTLSFVLLATAGQTQSSKPPQPPPTKAATPAVGRTPQGAKPKPAARPITADWSKFEKVHRAARALDAATDVGINYRKYQDLIQDLATEVKLVEDDETNDVEKRLAALYGEILDSSVDAAKWWRMSIDSVKPDSNNRYESAAHYSWALDRYQLYDKLEKAEMQFRWIEVGFALKRIASLRAGRSESENQAEEQALKGPKATALDALQGALAELLKNEPSYRRPAPEADCQSPTL